MARMARVVIPSIPHHITQRGVRRMQTFFDNEDYEAYLSLMHEWCFRLALRYGHIVFAQSYSFNRSAGG